MMFKTSNFKRAAAFGLAAVFLGWATGAQAQSSACGIMGSATSSPAVYDPFNNTPATAHVTLSLFRIDPTTANGAKTAVTSFYLRSTADANGTKVIPTSVTVSGGSSFIAGQSIFYDTSATGPFMGPPTSSTVPTSGNAYLKLAFTGNNAASDPATVQFDVILPANSNISASTTLALNAVFRCTTTGGGAPTDQSGTLSNAITFPVTILSALRTYYAGTALDFGEIGDITTPTLGSFPTTRTKTSPSNYLFVQSSGPYSVGLSSQNGFQLFKPGAAVANDKVAYRLRFLNRNVDSLTPSSAAGQTAINVNCVRAGLSAVPTVVGNVLPIQATLLEGGAGKNPSPTYSDILTITVTPLIYTAPGEACGTYGL